MWAERRNPPVPQADEPGGRFLHVAGNLPAGDGVNDLNHARPRRPRPQFGVHEAGDVFRRQRADERLDHAAIRMHDVGGGGNRCFRAEHVKGIDP